MCAVCLFSYHPTSPSPPAIFSFLLRLYASYPNSAIGARALEMSKFTLRAMADGGMHDHVGQVNEERVNKSTSILKELGMTEVKKQINK